MNKLHANPIYLHPKENLFVGRLEFEKKNSSSGTLRHFNIFTIIRKNDPVL